MREGEIQPDSEYASVQAFCVGRPILVPGDDDTVEGRWRRYFACPIWIPNPEGELSVAVITLASTLTNGCLTERHRSRLDKARPLLEDLGRQIATP